MTTNLNLEQRQRFIAQTQQHLATGQLTLGQAARNIRTDFYQMSQARYARFIGISEKTLRDIEKNNTDPRLSVLAKIFAPAGMQLIAYKK